MTSYYVQLRVSPGPEWLNIGEPYTMPEEAQQFRRTLLDGHGYSYRVVRAHTTYEVIDETSSPNQACSRRRTP